MRRTVGRIRRRPVLLVQVRDESEWTEAERADWAVRRALEAAWKSVQASEEGGPYTCPCCGHRTLPSRGSYDLCPECQWEDDGQDDHDSAAVRLGPNGGEVSTWHELATGPLGAGPNRTRCRTRLSDVPRLGAPRPG